MDNILTTPTNSPKALPVSPLLEISGRVPLFDITFNKPEKSFEVLTDSAKRNIFRSPHIDDSYTRESLGILHLSSPNAYFKSDSALRSKNRDKGGNKENEDITFKTPKRNKIRKSRLANRWDNTNLNTSNLGNDSTKFNKSLELLNQSLLDDIDPTRPSIPFAGGIPKITKNYKSEIDDVTKLIDLSDGDTDTFDDILNRNIIIKDSSSTNGSEENSNKDGSSKFVTSEIFLDEVSKSLGLNMLASPNFNRPVLFNRDDATGLLDPNRESFGILDPTRESLGILRLTSPTFRKLHSPTFERTSLSPTSSPIISKQLLNVADSVRSKISSCSSVLSFNSGSLAPSEISRISSIGQCVTPGFNPLNEGFVETSSKILSPPSFNFDSKYLNGADDVLQKHIENRKNRVSSVPVEVLESKKKAEEQLEKIRNCYSVTKPKKFKKINRRASCGNLLNFSDNYKPNFCSSFSSDKNLDCDDNVFNESVFIEAKYIASKISDGSILESPEGLHILDCTPQPEWEEVEETEVDRKKVNTEEVFKTLDRMLPNNNVTNISNITNKSNVTNTSNITNGSNITNSSNITNNSNVTSNGNINDKSKIINKSANESNGIGFRTPPNVINIVDCSTGSQNSNSMLSSKSNNESEKNISHSFVNNSGLSRVSSRGSLVKSKATNEVLQNLSEILIREHLTPQQGKQMLLTLAEMLYPESPTFNQQELKINLDDSGRSSLETVNQVPWEAINPQAVHSDLQETETEVPCDVENDKKKILEVSKSKIHELSISKRKLSSSVAENRILSRLSKNLNESNESNSSRVSTSSVITVNSSRIALSSASRISNSLLTINSSKSTVNSSNSSVNSSKFSINSSKISEANSKLAGNASNMTGNSSSNSVKSRNSSKLSEYKKFKPKKIEKTISQKGPLKAVIPVGQMAKKINVNANATPLKSIDQLSSVMQNNKTSTPKMVKEIIPVAQSTPDGGNQRFSSIMKNSSMVSSPLARTRTDCNTSSQLLNRSSSHPVMERTRKVSFEDAKYVSNKFIKRSNSIGQNSSISSFRSAVINSQKNKEIAMNSSNRKSDVVSKPESQRIQAYRERSRSLNFNIKPLNLAAKLKAVAK